MDESGLSGLWFFAVVGGTLILGLILVYGAVRSARMRRSLASPGEPEHATAPRPAETTGPRPKAERHAAGRRVLGAAIVGAGLLIAYFTYLLMRV